MEKIELTFLRPDEDTGNFIYKGTDGKIYISIDGIIHDVTQEREPLGPVYNTFVKPGEPVYNPEDRFGRNPGSKIQTENHKKLKNFIQEELIKLHKITLLEEEKRQINKELRLLKEGKEDLVDYDVPEWAMSALINGDLSGLEDEDIQKINSFTESVAKAHGNAHFMLGDIDGEDNLGFKHYNDIDNLGSNVYRLYINPDKETSFKDIPFNKRLQGGEYFVKETKDVDAMYKKAGMEPPHPGKGIHTKKFHKCVTSVGEKGGKNPYAICMSSLGKNKAVKADHRTEEGSSPMVDEIKKPIVPISEKTKAVLNKWIQEKGSKEAAVQLINRLSETGMVSDLPDSMEYGQGVNKIEALLKSGNLDQAFHLAKSLAKKLERKAMKDFGF